MLFPSSQADDPAKKGVCSNFLCDAKPGDDVKLTGPSGKVALAPRARAHMRMGSPCACVDMYAQAQRVLARSTCA